MKLNKREYVMTLTIPVQAYGHFIDTLQGDRKWFLNPFTIVLREDLFVLTRKIIAPDRGHAVYRAVQYYWMRFNGSLGSAWKILTVNDPYTEVSYKKDICCNDRKNNYLELDVKERVIKESNGILCDGGESGTVNHPARSLRLVKRRRKLPFRVKPHLYKDANGTLFYSVTVQPQSKYRYGGSMRKVRLVRLNAKQMHEAVQEIHNRDLLSQHLSNSKRNVKTRHEMMVGGGVL